MSGIKFSTAFGDREHLDGASPAAGVTESRRIVLLRNGRRHGRITRLITPWDIGELTRPFLFLCYSELAPGAKTVVGMQPGIGALTLVLSGVLVFEEAPGSKGTVVAGGLRWTVPGQVVWHAGGRRGDEPLRILQLWVELPPERGRSTAESQCIAPHEVQEEGSVRVALGQIGRARSRIVHAPPKTNYFHVRLKDGQRWSYAAPDGHNVTWVAVDRGGLRLERDGSILREQVALFERSAGVIEVHAEGESSFVLGSARQDCKALMQSGGRPMDTFLEALVPGELEEAARLLMASFPGPRLRIASVHPNLGSAASVLDRRLARGKRQ
jgi:redox-sensitive bicupin YhaK (pirin superfamily)